MDDEHGIIARGHPRNPAIVFLHAAATTKLTFRPQCEELCDEYYCLALDAEGHGDLAMSADGGTWAMRPTVQRAVRIIRDRCRGQAAVIVGVSLGGYTALEITRQHPECVHALFLSGCYHDFTGNGAFAEGIVDGYEDKIARNRFWSTDPANQQRRDELWNECMLPGLTKQNASVTMADWGEHCATYLSGIERLSGPCELHMPHTEVAGPLHSRAKAEKLAARCGVSSGARAAVATIGDPIQNVGHHWNLEEPLLFASLVRQLARRVIAALDSKEEGLALERLFSEGMQDPTQTSTLHPSPSTFHPPPSTLHSPPFSLTIHPHPYPHAHPTLTQR